MNPATYTVKLTVNGKSYTQPIIVRQDPRVKTPTPAMQEVYAATQAMYFGAVDATTAVAQLASLREQIGRITPQAAGAAAAALAQFDRKSAALLGQPPAGIGGAPPEASGGGRGGGGRGGGAPPMPSPGSLPAVVAALSGSMNVLQGADVAPTANQRAAIAAARDTAAGVMTRWNALKTTELATLNALLKAAGLAPIVVR